MNTKQRLELIKEVGEEIVTVKDLTNFLEGKKSFIAYDGFEPSGTDIHIAQGLLRAININKMIKAGAKFKMLVADWHAWANNKMSGDLEKIKKVGKYFVEVWKACGMDLNNVDFIWASNLLDNKDYWKIVMQVARNSTLNRILRTTQIMGRSEKDLLQASQILYPCMQAADIFYLKAEVTQLGMDQRKVNVLAREIGPKIGYWKPIVVSHHMLMGLQQPPKNMDEKDPAERAIFLKMSKSKPDTAIFMTDSEKEIKRKISKAWCPPTIEENPIMEYFKYIVFAKYDYIEIKRLEKFGGNLKIKNYKDLCNNYSNNKIHPMDLKNTCAIYINDLITPIREKLLNNPKIKKMREEIKSFKVTR